MVSQKQSAQVLPPLKHSTMYSDLQKLLGRNNSLNQHASAKPVLELKTTDYDDIREEARRMTKVDRDDLVSEYFSAKRSMK